MLAAAVVTLGGCTATTYAEPEPAYVELTAAPVNIEPYPSTYYEGRTVYLVNNRWMYRDRGGWAYYRNEPPALYRQRTYVQQAPPAYRRGYPAPNAYPRQGYPQTYPQRQYEQRAPGLNGAPPSSAPPAVRVQ